MMFGKLRDHGLPAVHEILNGLERRRVVQAAVRRAVVARDHILDQLLAPRPCGPQGNLRLYVLLDELERSM
jgi:hypothetical protein